MATYITERILDAVKQGDGADLDTLARSLPDLTWNQVFSEIDRLSRAGMIKVKCETSGRYLLQMPSDDRQHV